MNRVRRTAAVLALALVACALVTIAAVPSLRRAVVGPVAFAVWIGRLALMAVPQAVWWVLLILVGSFAAVRTLSSLMSGRRRRHYAPVTRSGPVRVWARDIERAPWGDYYHDRLVRGLRAVTVAVLGHTSRRPEDEIRRGLAAGALDVPQDVYAAIGAGAGSVHGGLRSRRLPRFVRRVTGPRRAEEAPSGLECVIAFLEDQLEVERDDEAS